MRLADGLRRVTCPVFIVAPSEDGFSTADETAEIEAAVVARPPGAGIGKVWNVEAGQHLTAAYDNPELYRQKLLAFLDEALGTSQTSQGPGPVATPSSAGR